MEAETPRFKFRLTHKFIIVVLLLVALEVLAVTTYPAIKHQRSPFSQAFKLRSLLFSRDKKMSQPLLWNENIDSDKSFPRDEKRSIDYLALEPTKTSKTELNVKKRIESKYNENNEADIPKGFLRR